MTHVCFSLVLFLMSLTIGLQGKLVKPNFTGTWKFNAAKSKLQIAAPDSTVFVVEHREPRFHLTRTHVFNGQSDTWEIELTTDGKEVVREEPTRTLRCRMYWEGDALVFLVRIRKHDGEKVTDRVRYVLAADGKSIAAYESYRGRTQRADNVWILEKQD